MKRLARIALAGVLTLAGLAGSSHAAGVVVVRSSDLPMVDATARAFRTAFRGEVSEITLGRGDPNALVAEVERRSPEVVVAIGLRAAMLVRERLPRTPLVYAMVPDPGRHDLVGSGVTGVAADIPPAVELKALSGLLPGVRRLGVIVGPGSGDWVRQARAAATKHGIALEVAMVEKIDQFAPQVRDLMARTDALWMPADPSIATPESFRFALEQSVARRRPLLAFSPGLVQAGAMGAAAHKSEWVGERAAEAVRRVQGGERPGDVPSTDVRRVQLFANLATARAIGLELTKAALRDVEVVR